MRHLRSFAALLTIAAITVACGSSSSSGGESQGSEPSTGSQPSQAAASSGGGGGGGGGGGANGSMTYEITGDYEASGELPFLTSSLWVQELEGWAAYFAQADGTGAVIQINTQSAEGTSGQIWNFGDGTALVVATSDPSNECTFTLTKNDSSGTAGSVECTKALYTLVSGAGGNGTVHVSAEWEGHP